ncbi:MAG TPA: hypothetical protein PLD88_00155, partial [Candidatus Berkiella sp.]|nr:hypothetical protein [Candidatus Berkiella sp.]
MSSGSNIPPPPKGGPKIPSPAQGGHMPPSGPGAMAPAKKLTEMTKDERVAWIDSRSGLNLKVLKAGRYPNEADILTRVGARESDAGKGIPDSDTEIQKKIAAELQTILKAKLIELFTLAETDPTKAAPLIQKIEDNMKRWKGSAVGLNDYHDLLQKELPSSTAKARSRTLPPPDLNDKEYQKLLTIERKAKQESSELIKEYENLHQQYQTAGNEKKSKLYEQLAAVV